MSATLLNLGIDFWDLRSIILFDSMKCIYCIFQSFGKQFDKVADEDSQLIHFYPYDSALPYTLSKFVVLPDCCFFVVLDFNQNAMQSIFLVFLLQQNNICNFNNY